MSCSCRSSWWREVGGGCTRIEGFETVPKQKKKKERKYIFYSFTMMDFGAFMRALSKTEDRKVGPIEPCIDHGAKHFAKRKEQVLLSLSRARALSLFPFFLSCLLFDH